MTKVDTLRQLAPVIDAKKMLKLFVKEFNTEGHTHVTEDFVIDLFDQCGIHDAEIAKHLFRLVSFVYFYEISLYIYRETDSETVHIYMFYLIRRCAKYLMMLHRWIGTIMEN